MRFPYGRECVRLRAGRKYNPASGENDALDWSDAAVDRLPLPGTVIAPASVDEPITDDSNTLVIKMSWYGEHGSDVRHRDRIIDPGLLDEDGAPIVWEVTGSAPAGEWLNPYTGWKAGSEIPVEQVA